MSFFQKLDPEVAVYHRTKQESDWQATLFAWTMLLLIFALGVVFTGGFLNIGIVGFVIGIPFGIAGVWLVGESLGG